MATGNTQYAIASGNSITYAGAYSAFSVEVSIRQDWENVWLRAHPLLAVIKDGESNWNKKGLRKGNMMILPIALGASATMADGVADADELTPVSPYITSNATQAAYNIAHYQGFFWVRSSERQLINNARGDFMQFKVQQKRDEFMDEIADDLASTAIDSRTAVLGIQQALATSNTVGGIAQGTDTDWAANVTTSYGAFNLDLFDNGRHAVRARNGKVDLCLLAYSSTNDLYAKLLANISQAQRIVDAGFEATYGFETVMLSGMRCVMDNRLTAGVICGLDTRTWYYCGDDRPTAYAPQRTPGTVADEYAYDMFCGVGVSNPARNFRYTGVT